MFIMMLKGFGSYPASPCTLRFVLWGMAFWADNHLYEALTGAASAPAANPIQGLVSVWVQRLLYIVFPLAWLAALGWVGVKAHTAMGAVSKLADSTARAAQAGAGAAVGAGKAAVLRGRRR